MSHEFGMAAEALSVLRASLISASLEEVIARMMMAMGQNRASGSDPWSDLGQTMHEPQYTKLTVRFRHV